MPPHQHQRTGTHVHPTTPHQSLACNVVKLNHDGGPHFVKPFFERSMNRPFPDWRHGVSLGVLRRGTRRGSLQELGGSAPTSRCALLKRLCDGVPMVQPPRPACNSSPLKKLARQSMCAVLLLLVFYTICTQRCCLRWSTAERQEEGACECYWRRRPDNAGHLQLARVKVITCCF